MYHALDHRLDTRTSRRTLALFWVTFLAAVVVSPVFALYGMLLGAAGLVGAGLLGRVRESTGTMTATVVFAGVLAGSLPYLAAAPFVF
jgi:site-specific recombinase